MCERLWCTSPEVETVACRTNNRLMALPGTTCGYGMVSLSLFTVYFQCLARSIKNTVHYDTVLPAKSDRDVMFCLQSYQGLIIDISLLY